MVLSTMNSYLKWVKWNAAFWPKLTLLYSQTAPVQTHTYELVVCYCRLKCLQMLSKWSWMYCKTKAMPLDDLPGRKLPQQTGPKASLQPVSLTNQNSERNSEQTMPAALHQLFGELKRLTDYHHFFNLTKTSVTSCATSLSVFPHHDAPTTVWHLWYG